jgi:hypothetical protein
MQILNELLDSLIVGAPQVFEEVQIIPLFSKQPEVAATFLQLDEALKQGLAEIKEVSDAGSVPQLSVINKSPQDIIIYEGQQLIGAKQNRIVNITVIIAAHTTLPIPVSCVEQGRWRYNSPGFASSNHFTYPSLRCASHRDVTRSKQSCGTSDADQSKVWSDISAKSVRMNVHTATMAMADIYERHAPDPEILNATFSVGENQIGYMAFIKGGFAGSDLFASTEVCRGKMGKLLRGYYLDSRDHGVTFEKVEIDEILREVKTAEHREFDTVGKGRERRFDAAHVQGSWKEVDGLIPHLTILPRG